MGNTCTQLTDMCMHAAQMTETLQGQKKGNSGTHLTGA